MPPRLSIVLAPVLDICPDEPTVTVPSPFRLLQRSPPRFRLMQRSKLKIVIKLLRQRRILAFVVAAKAGPHNHRSLGKKRVRHLAQHQTSRSMDPGLRRDDALET
jgi:hypothetical protein